jgi:hypothetical protein
MENDVEVSGHGLIGGSILAIYLEGLKKISFLTASVELRSGPGTFSEM